VVHLGGGRRHTKDLPGGAPGRRRREDLRGSTPVPVAADSTCDSGQVREKSRECENPWKRGVTFWVIGFCMYSPRASNAPGNTVENARHLGGLLRFWPKRRKKSKTK
jgi:hypothetical protein